MTDSADFAVDPNLDLLLERVVDASPERVWQAWTRPEQLKRWFTPAPWQTVDCEIDLRPGGMFRTVMRSPEGQEFPNIGCFLEIVENRTLVWTDALLPGFRPSNRNPAVDASCGLHSFITAVISLEPHARGTRYRAMALHRDATGAQQHAQMGFHEGWGAALDQMVAMLKSELS